MYAAILLTLCGQFGPIFDETVKPKPAEKIDVVKVDEPLSVEFLSQAPIGTDGKIYIKAYSGKSCKWCKQEHDLVGEGDERVAIDWTEDELPDTVRKKLHAGYQFPVFVCEQEDGTLSYPNTWNIYNRDQLVSMFSVTKPRKVKTYAAAGVGGVIHGRQHVEQMFKWLDENVGRDVKIIISWDRTGAQTFPFKSGANWSANAILGRMGYFDLKAQGAKNILFSEIATGYRYIDNTDDLEITPKIVIKSFNVNKFNASEDVPRKLDPITISTIISIGQILYQILNPKIDLQLPGNLETEMIYTGDRFQVDFNRGPSIHISAWFEFNLAVQRALLDLQKLHLDFTGSRWIKSRDINIVD